MYPSTKENAPMKTFASVLAGSLMAALILPGIGLAASSVTIRTQPKNLELVCGGTAIFSVSATGNTGTLS